MNPTLPNEIYSGLWKEGHVQGIAVDQTRGFVYFSFTTILLKTDLAGNPLGSVENLAGHLGCITYDAADNLIYGSLELKHDAIGAGIINRTGWDPSKEDSFYLVCFDLDKIDRMGMDAEKDGVMRAVYLQDVVDDYLATDEVSGQKHRYGCSGCDGTAYGPAFGSDPNAPKKIVIAYGVYEDNDREDNDYQVLLQYDKSVIEKYALPLNQSSPHHSGPEKAELRYFFYTGNTRYGIQNLEYDPASHHWFAAVYKGKKEAYTNFSLFAIDGSTAPVEMKLKGRGNEVGKVLFTAPMGTLGKEGTIHGSDFPYGSTGLASLGDGSFYISHPESNKEEHTFASRLFQYQLDKADPLLFTKKDT